MDYKKIRLSVTDRVATITLADPATMNAAGVDTVIELADAFGRVAAGEDGARAVILTGEGRGFCSGANLSGGGATTRPPEADGRPDAGSALESHYNPFVTLMRNFPMPIVTAVNGAAAGVGCSLALMGDLIVAGESAYFLQAFRRIGLVPDGGSTYLLPRLIGRARAMEMTMLGERIGAAKALEWGLVNRVVPDADLIDRSHQARPGDGERTQGAGPHPQSDVAEPGRRLDRSAGQRAADPDGGRQDRRLHRRGSGLSAEAPGGVSGALITGRRGACPG